MKATAFIVAVAALGLQSPAFADHHGKGHELNPLGTWEVSAAMDLETRDSTLLITKTEEGLKAVITPDEGDVMTMTRATVDGKTLTIELDFEQDGQAGIIGAKASLNEKGALSGKWYVRDTNGQEWMTNDWEAARSVKASLGGKWAVVARTQDNDMEHEIVFANEANKWTATAQSGQGSADFEKVRAMKDNLRLEMPWGDGKVRINAKLTAADRFKGAWTYVDEFGDEAATGDWIAEKAEEEAQEAE